MFVCTEALEAEQWYWKRTMFVCTEALEVEQWYWKRTMFVRTEALEAEKWYWKRTMFMWTEALEAEQWYWKRTMFMFTEAFLCRRFDGLDCAAWRPPRPVAQCRQFPKEAKHASVSECTWTLSAFEALHNALYKFKTYLLTYIRSRAVVLKENNVLVYRKKLSSGSHNGYDFTEFQTYFDEHRRLRAEEQLCELRRCTLPATCAASVSNLSADFVSTATSPCHAAVTNNSECCRCFVKPWCSGQITCCSCSHVACGVNTCGSCHCRWMCDGGIWEYKSDDRLSSLVSHMPQRRRNRRLSQWLHWGIDVAAEWRHFQLLWMTHNPHFKSMPLFDV